MNHLFPRLILGMWQLAFGWLPLFIPQKFIRQIVSFRPPRQLPGFIQMFWPYSAVSLAMVTLGLGGTIYFGMQAAAGSELERVTTFSVPAPQIATAQAARGLTRSEPTSLQIDSLKISGGITAVGRLADGTMETPPLFSHASGWYKYSPTPGEIGPAVIVGHVDTYKGPSIFWRLRELKPGDEIRIARADKSIVRFKVEALKQFEQNNFPTAEVYGNIDYAGLRLITCGGSFNHKTGHYTQNTVVFASMIHEPVHG